MDTIRNASEIRSIESLGQTVSVCPVCLNTVPAALRRVGEDVFLDKACPRHGRFSTLIWHGPPSFTSWVRPKIPSTPRNPMTEEKNGCPFDCGLCPQHRQHTCTALLEVTHRCNLVCPICFADSGALGKPDDPSLAVVGNWYEHVLKASGPVNIQISGGEPTLREDLVNIIALGQKKGFPFIQLNTNGILLGQGPALAKRLQAAGLSSVFLQFDGTCDGIYRRMRGKDLFELKLKAIDHCAEAGIGVVLVPTVVSGINDQEIGALITLGLKLAPAVRGIHFQPMSHFGRFPNEPQHPARITLPEVMQALEAQTHGRIKVHHLKPPGCEHALCSFHGRFVLLEDGALLPLAQHDTGCCPLPIPAEEGSKKAIKITAEQWKAPFAGHPDDFPTAPCDCRSEPRAPLSASPPVQDLDSFLSRIKTHTFSVSGMAFQDAWTLDLERLKGCCIHTFSPDGRLIPFCAYNLTNTKGVALYRGQQ